MTTRGGGLDPPDDEGGASSGGGVSLSLRVGTPGRGPRVPQAGSPRMGGGPEAGALRRGTSKEHLAHPLPATPLAPVRARRPPVYRAVGAGT